MAVLSKILGIEISESCMELPLGTAGAQSWSGVGRGKGTSLWHMPGAPRGPHQAHKGQAKVEMEG